jgi:two-component system, NarL family, response regulator DevR
MVEKWASQQALEFIGDGLTNREIAGRMSVTEEIAKDYVSSKLRMQRRTQAAVCAAQLAKNGVG